LLVVTVPGRSDDMRFPLDVAPANALPSTAP